MKQPTRMKHNHVGRSYHSHHHGLHSALRTSYDPYPYYVLQPEIINEVPVPVAVVSQQPPRQQPQQPEVIIVEKSSAGNNFFMLLVPVFLVIIILVVAGLKM